MKRGVEPIGMVQAPRVGETQGTWKGEPRLQGVLPSRHWDGETRRSRAVTGG